MYRAASALLAQLLDELRVAGRQGAYCGQSLQRLRRLGDLGRQHGEEVCFKFRMPPRQTLDRGDAQATIWTCDLSHDYVSINADYRS